MAMFDPATGKWYTYNPGSPGAITDESGIPTGVVSPSLTLAGAPEGAPGNLSQFVDPTNNDPNATAAKLLRAQFEEWQKSFKPIELNAMKGVSFNNPNVLPEAINKATGTAIRQADTMRGVLSRSNASMGIVPTAQQEKVSNRILNLDRSTAVAEASNKARENVRLQDEQILLGGVPNQNIVKGTI